MGHREEERVAKLEGSFSGIENGGKKKKNPSKGERRNCHPRYMIRIGGAERDCYESCPAARGQVDAGETASYRQQSWMSV